MLPSSKLRLPATGTMQVWVILSLSHYRLLRSIGVMEAARSKLWTYGPSSKWGNRSCGGFMLIHGDFSIIIISTMEILMIFICDQPWWSRLLSIRLLVNFSSDFSSGISSSLHLWWHSSTKKAKWHRELYLRCVVKYRARFIADRIHLWYKTFRLIGCLSFCRSS